MMAVLISCIDGCCLTDSSTRAQQYDRGQPWNAQTHVYVLRNHRQSNTDDQLEHNWGYERPQIVRKIDIETPDGLHLDRMPSSKTHCNDHTILVFQSQPKIV
jgi:hypothetical protein